MKIFRSPYLTAVLFVLISLGQGFSFSYLFSSYQKGEGASPKSGVAQENPPANSILVCNSQWEPTVAEKPLPTRTREEVLSFRMEPFLPSFVNLFDFRWQNHRMEEVSLPLLSILFTPEPPPPKG